MQEKEGALCHPTDFSPWSEPLPAVMLSWALPALPGGTVLGWSHPTALPVEPILSPRAAFLFPPAPSSSPCTSSQLPAEAQ